MTSAVAYLILAPLLAALSLATGPRVEPDAAAPPNAHARPGAAVWPLAPRPEVVAHFTPPADTWGSGHRGVDLAGDPGQAVRAAQAGTITFAGRLAGRGVLVVGHGATRTTYEPVTASATVGDTVAAGQPIGTLETFASHCWPATCLHWGLIEGRTYLNPLTLVGAGPVRLLPLYSWLPLLQGASAGSAPVVPWAPPLRPGGVLVGRPDGVGRW